MAQFLIENLLNTSSATWQFVNSGIANTTGFIMPVGTKAGDFVVFSAAAVGTSGTTGRAPTGGSGISGYSGYAVLATLTTNTASTNTTIGYINNLPGSNTNFILMNGGGTIAAGIVYVYRPINIPTFAFDPIPANSGFVSTALAKNSSPTPPSVNSITQTNLIFIFGTNAANSTPTAPTGYVNLKYQTNSTVTVMGAVTSQQGIGTITPGQFGNGAGSTNSCSSATVVLRTKTIPGIVPFLSRGTNPVYCQNAVFDVITTTNSTISAEVGGAYTISISGGSNSAYSVNGSAFTNSIGIVNIPNGGSINVAVSQTTTNTAPGTNTTTTTTLTVGDQSNTYSVLNARAYTRSGSPLTASFNYDANVTGVYIVAVGGGGTSNGKHGGSGGTLVTRNVATVNSTANVVILAGQRASITFGPINGGNSSVTIAGSTVALARGGISANSTAGGVAVTTGSVGNSIFAGGNGGTGNSTIAAGGGGAGGYTGVGGNGGANSAAGTAGTNDAGGGGGGGGAYGGGGGGTGISGPVSAGAGGAANSSGGRGGFEGSVDVFAANGGSGSGFSAGDGGACGGGGGGGGGDGGQGYIRITW